MELHLQPLSSLFYRFVHILILFGQKKNNQTDTAATEFFLLRLSQGTSFNIFNSLFNCHLLINIGIAEHFSKSCLVSAMNTHSSFY